jgi:hypothetical protein
MSAIERNPDIHAHHRFEPAFSRFQPSDEPCQGPGAGGKLMALFGTMPATSRAQQP